MKGTLGAIVLVLLLIPPASAQDLDIFGYFEPQFNLVSWDDGSYQLQSNKLRVDLRSHLDEDIEFGANFDWIVYHEIV